MQAPKEKRNEQMSLAHRKYLVNFIRSGGNYKSFRAEYLRIFKKETSRSTFTRLKRDSEKIRDCYKRKYAIKPSINFFHIFSEFRENFKNASLLSTSLLRMTVYILVYLHTRYLSARHLPRSSTIACISAGAGVVHDCLN